MKSLQQILSLATSFLEKHRISRPRLVAETLLAHSLAMKRIDLYMNFDRPVVEAELELFREALKRAKEGEPFEYILGNVSFFNCEIQVDSRVLIPRQETEILLDLVVKRLNGQEKRALDLCTGSGCLAIGLKKACPHLDVVGVDFSKEALEVAQKNSQANGVEISWLQGDMTEPVVDQRFDLVLCNPPYISEEEFQSLDRSVREFEPKIALVSGPTGLEFYERLQDSLPQLLNPSAQVFFEIGASQRGEINRLFSLGNWKEVEGISDWAGQDRFFSLKM